MDDDSSRAGAALSPNIQASVPAMVERVAKAITIETMKRAGFWATLPTPTAQTRAVDISFPEALPIARAAIEAMREPTEHMVKVARDPRTANGSPVSKGVHDTWSAMIDAALAERVA